MKRRSFSDVLVLGMALFSMFFGAGNIIFPPYLGMQSGTQWGAGFFSYYMADIGLSVVAILALLKQRGDMDRVIGAVGLYGASREHICLAFEVAVVVKDLERTEQVV